MTWALAASIIFWVLGANLAHDVYPEALEQQGIYDKTNKIHRFAMWLCIAAWPILEVYTIATYKKEQGE